MKRVYLNNLNNLRIAADGDAETSLRLLRLLSRTGLYGNCLSRSIHHQPQSIGNNPMTTQAIKTKYNHHPIPLLTISRILELAAEADLTMIRRMRCRSTSTLLTEADMVRIDSEKALRREAVNVLAAALGAEATEEGMPWARWAGIHESDHGKRDVRLLSTGGYDRLKFAQPLMAHGEPVGVLTGINLPPFEDLTLGRQLVGIPLAVSLTGGGTVGVMWCRREQQLTLTERLSHLATTEQAAISEARRVTMMVWGSRAVSVMDERALLKGWVAMEEVR
jgi:hypothetical protein